MSIQHQNITAEQSVLGGLMLDNATFPKVSALITENDFFNKNHQLIFSAIKKLAAKKQPFDVVTLSEQLEADNALISIGGLSYLGTLARDTPSAANIEAYANIVQEKATLRQIERLVNSGDIAKINTLLAKKADKSKQAGSFNEVLDAQDKVKTIDLLSHIADEHLLKKMSLEVAKAFHLPESTVFLMALAVFSSVSCRHYRVMYEDNVNALPIGLYAIAEQPSGVGKSRCLSVFHYPFMRIHKELLNERKKEINRLLRNKELSEGLNENDQETLFELQNTPLPQLFTTNATPEGLEKTLANNKGFFAAISSEQGLFNSLFGKSYSNGANNNDVVLNGFDGGFINVNRSGRDGYSGNVVGAVVCFAQYGSVETILDASQGTGLSERFLMLVEPHKLGERDHAIQYKLSELLLIEYANACTFALSAFDNPEEYSEIGTLFITKEGFALITDYKNSIEPELADGRKYSFPALRGVASKINMQIMKIAANLHLIDLEYRMKMSPVIADRHIKSAIAIADRLLQHQRAMMIDKGIIGIKAEYQAIMDYFEIKPIGSEREIINNKRKVKPFKDSTGNISDEIRQNLAEMVKAGLLSSFTNEDGKTSYSLGQ